MKQKTGDLQAFLQHEAWIRRLARSLVLDESRADEVVQQVWLSALKYQPDTTRNLRPWISVVARSAARKLSRSEGRKNRREKAAAKPEQIPAETTRIDQDDLQRSLSEFVQGLEEPYRSLVRQHFFEGKTLEEIAQHLRLPSSTVRSRLKRVLAEMRVRLDRKYGDRSLWVAAALPWLEISVGSGAAPVSSAAKGWISQSPWLKAMGVAALAVSLPAAALLVPQAAEPELGRAPATKIGLDAGLPQEPAEPAAAQEPRSAASRLPVGESPVASAPVSAPEPAKPKTISKENRRVTRDPGDRINAGRKIALKAEDE